MACVPTSVVVFILSAAAAAVNGPVICRVIVRVALGMGLIPSMKVVELKMPSPKEGIAVGFTGSMTSTVAVKIATFPVATANAAASTPTAFVYRALLSGMFDPLALSDSVVVAAIDAATTLIPAGVTADVLSSELLLPASVGTAS